MAHPCPYDDAYWLGTDPKEVHGKGRYDRLPRNWITGAKLIHGWLWTVSEVEALMASGLVPHRIVTSNRSKLNRKVNGNAWQVAYFRLDPKEDRGPLLKKLQDACRSLIRLDEVPGIALPVF